LIAPAGGLAFGHVVEPLLFHVKAMDLATLVTPIMVLTAIAAFTAFAPAIRAVRIDPAQTLRAESGFARNTRHTLRAWCTRVCKRHHHLR